MPSRPTGDVSQRALDGNAELVKASDMTTDDETRIPITARPGALELSLASTAVIVVDMQNDFASPDGMFGRAGISLGGIGAVVEPTRRVLDAARHEGLPIIYLVMQFREDLANLGPANAPNRTRHLVMGAGQTIDAPDGNKSRIMVRDTWNTRIIEELTPHGGDIVVPKHRYSGFFETDLDDILRRHNINTIIFTGCTTSVCVEGTLRDAFYRDYQCLLLTDCCAEAVGGDQARTNHDATVTVIEALFGWTTESEHFIDAISRSDAEMADATS